MSPISQTASTPASAPTTSSSSTSATAPVTESMFLKLLVAQLQNQDPSNPADSTQFVTQLAQFQTMEQSLNQGSTMTSMLTDLNQLVAALPASSNGANSNGSSGTTPTP